MRDDDTVVELETLPSDPEVVARLARDGTAPHEVLLAGGDGPAKVGLWFGNGPDGHRLVHREDLTLLEPEPPAKTGTVKVATPEALRTYAERHLDGDHSTLWAEIDDGRLTVIFNDHSNYSPAGWADHRVVLQMARAREWVDWTDLSGTWVGQEELAVFLEEHLHHVSDPDGSTLLDVTQTLHATSNVTFTSSKRLADGTQQLVWDEDIQAAAGRGQQTQIPTDLTLHLRPWVGVDEVPVAGKFRFRISHGDLKLRVDLLNVAEASRESVEQSAHEVADALGLPPIEGTPPASRR